VTCRAGITSTAHAMASALRWCPADSPLYVLITTTQWGVPCANRSLERAVSAFELATICASANYLCAHGSFGAAEW